jgi:hypothetical protein
VQSLILSQIFPIHPTRYLALLLALPVLLGFWDSEGFAESRKRRIKRQEAVAATPAPLWFGSLGVSYFNYVTPGELTGGKTVAANMQLGLQLSPVLSVFLQATYAFELKGFQDLRAGVSRSFTVSESFSSFLFFSLSAPTSKASREVALTTQASGAGGLSYQKNSFSAHATLYAGKSFYSLRPKARVEAETLEYSASSVFLSSSNKLKGGGAQPALKRPGRIYRALALQNSPGAEDGSGTPDTNVPQFIYLVLFDKYYGESLRLEYSINREIAVETSASLTRSAFANSPDLWSSEIIYLQLSWAKKSLSVFINTGALDNEYTPIVPKTQTYSAGIDYSFR